MAITSPPYLRAGASFASGGWTVCNPAMDAFEQVVAEILWTNGHWTQTSYKVSLTKEEKRRIGRASSPRWDIDVLPTIRARTSSDLWSARATWIRTECAQAHSTALALYFPSELITSTYVIARHGAGDDLGPDSRSDHAGPLSRPRSSRTGIRRN
jgi:hypothetical protein